MTDVSRRRVLRVAAGAAAAAAGAGTVRADEAADAASTGISFAVWAAINTATQGYGDCLDRFDIEGLTALFSEDCVYDYAPGLVMRGREQVAAGARKSLAKVERSSHFVGPPVVRPGGAPGVYASLVYFAAVHEQKDGGHHTLYGRYLDVFTPDSAGRLLIAHRETLAHVGLGPQSPHHWLPRQPS